MSRYPLIILKGMAMGAADVVPGVSGGTIAFIAGIYEELVNSIKAIDLTAFKLLFTGRFGQFWKKINGGFLLSVVLGIAISIFSLARLMTWLLENRPVETWSFFFGLIVSSTILVSRDVKQWRPGTIAAFGAGIVAAFVITVLTPATSPQTWWFTMLSGAIAICAMILPGISGAFILLLIGQYHYIMSAVSGFDIPVIILFVVGAAAGVICFSHALSWMLRRHRNGTIALLTGFMVGSLNKVWPWKEVIETYTDSHGATHPLVERNVLPSLCEAAQGAYLWEAALWCAAGFIFIWAIEYVASLAKRRR